MNKPTPPQQIRIDNISPSPFNRKITTDDELRELAESIKVQGILQDLLVRPSPNGSGGYELVAGERRWRAARLAKLSTVPCKILPVTDPQVIEIQTVENLQRKNVTAFEEAEGYSQLSKLGRKPVEIAKQVGKSLSYIYGRLQLLKCSETVKMAVRQQQITPSHALLLVGLTIEQQQSLVDEIIDMNWSVEDLENELKHYRFKSLSLACWKLTDLDVRINEKAGPCSVCPKNTSVNETLRESLHAKPGLCTDSDCFEKKIDRFIDRTVFEAKSKGIKLTRLDRSWSYNYRLAKKGEKHAQDGIVATGPDTGKVVKFISTREATHKSSGISYQEQSRRRKEKAQRERAWRIPVFEAVVKKVRKLGPTELALIERSMSDNGRKKTKGTIEQRLITLALEDQAHVQEYRIKPPKDLLAFARRYKVNVKPYQQQAKKKQKEKAK